MRTVSKRPAQSRWSRLIPLVGALVVIVSNACAQVPGPNVSPWQKRSLTPAEQRERQKKLDDAYKAAAKNITDQSRTTLGPPFDRRPRRQINDSLRGGLRR